jgi:hypothetical protein
MTLPASGNPISISQINTEFALGNSLSSYRGVTWYTDAGSSGTFSSTNLGMDQFYSKRKTSPLTVSLSSLQSQTFYDATVGDVTVTLTLSTNGTWSATGSVSGSLGSGNWASPTTSGVGNSYWVRFTRTSVDLSGGTSTGTTGWLQLSSARSVTDTKYSSSGGSFSSVYTIQISSDSGGSTIVASCTNVTLTAVNEG